MGSFPIFEQARLRSFRKGSFTITMKNLALAALAAICLAISLGTGSAYAQSNPLPLGKVNQPVKSVTCPDGFDSGTACHASTVSCPDTLDIGFTYEIGR